MKIRLFSKLNLVFLSLSFCANVNAQCVNFSLSTQEDVDNFPSFCSEVLGSLNIGVGFDITNLDGLSNITSIDGNLTINAKNLTDFTGLNNLTYVGGDFGLSGMDELTSLNGLESLETVGGTFAVGGVKLSSLEGVTSLTQVGWLSIGSTELLTSLEGLENLSLVDNVNIDNNSLLADLSGLESLTSIKGRLSISLNPFLKSFNGLHNLQSIGEEGVNDFMKSLYVWDNDQLACLDGLNSLTYIGGNLEIEGNQHLLGLTGLENLETIGADIILTGNQELIACNLPSICDLLDQVNNVQISGNAPGCESMPDIQNICDSYGQCVSDIKLVIQNQVDQFSIIFPNCTEIPGNLDLGENLSFGIPPINNLLGLSQLTGIDGNFYLATNDDIAIENFEGLENLNYIGGEFRILWNNGITTLDGLSSLDTIFGDVRIDLVSNIANVNGFSSLKHIGGELLIINNDLLSSLEGFKYLQSVGSNIYVLENDNLVSLVGLDNIESIGGSLNFVDNPNLSDCAVWSVCNHISNAINTYTINSNKTGCNADTEILNFCGSFLSQMQGKVFADLDCNNIQDQNEGNIPYLLIKDSISELPYALTNANGEYRGFVPSEGTTVFYPDEVYGFSPSPLSLSISTDTIPIIYYNQDFGLCPDLSFHNLSVGLTAVDPPRPGFSNNYQICFENTGSNIENATIEFDFSDMSSGDFVQFVEIDGGLVNGSTINWTNNNVGVFQAECYHITVEISSAAPLGTLLFPRATISSQNGVDEVDYDDNISNFEQEIIGSYDPNDKTVNLDSINFNLTNEGVELEYLIRFQNTGTFPATFVEVFDTIQPNLDMASFRMIAASHDYTVSFFEDNNVIKWRFANINLPDSTSNESESHGFIKFSIETIPGLVLGDIIENRAAIYFDFNEPVITNSTTTSVVLLSSINALNNINDFTVYPNPVGRTLFLNYTLKSDSKVQIIVSDTNGNRITNIEKNSTQAGNHTEKIDLNNTTAGVYFVRLLTEFESVIKKVIIQR